jgi:type VI secretion system ImpA family protein
MGPELFHPDLERLLAPISADRPGGEWLRDGSVYEAIREARREEDSSLAQGVWQRELKRADWEQVEETAADALETRSKDLQLAVWLLEAWLHRAGFAAVAPGLALLAELCEAFWDHLWPPIEGSDLEYRVAPFHWLNEKLFLTMKRIPVTWPGGDEAPAFTWADWESAARLARITEMEPDKARGAEGRGRVTREKFLASVTLTPSAFFQRLAGDIDDGLAALERLEEVLDQRCGTEAPGLGQFRGALEAIGHFVHGALRERAQDVGAEGPEGLEAAAGATVGPPGESLVEPPITAGGPIRNRAEAYRRLSEAAEYLLRTEPHSPTPYLVRRAVAWGGMTLSEVLAELLQNHADLATVYQLLGIREVVRR